MASNYEAYKGHSYTTVAYGTLTKFMDNLEATGSGQDEFLKNLWYGDLDYDATTGERILYPKSYDDGYYPVTIQATSDAAISTGRYYLQDIIASAKGAGYSNTDIANALNAAGVKNVYDSKKTWQNTDVKTYNIGFNDSTKKIQERLDKDYADLDAYVSVVSKDASDDYRIRVSYIDPVDGKRKYRDITDSDGILDGSADDTKIGDLFVDGTFAGAINAARDAKVAADTKKDWGAFADAASDLKNTFKAQAGAAANIKSDFNITDEQRQSLIVDNPDYKTSQQLINKVEGSPVAKDLLNDLINLNQEQIKLTDPEDIKENVQAINKIQEQLSNLGVTSAEQTALNNIIRDPNLLTNIEAQRSKDAAAGTIVGQRAANAQAIADESGAGYAEQAEAVREATKDLANSQMQNALSTSVGGTTLNATQNLNAALNQEEQRAIAVENLKSGLDLLRLGINAELTKAERASEASRTAVKNKGETLKQDTENELRASMQTADNVVNSLLAEYTDLQNLSQYVGADADIPGLLKKLYGEAATVDNLAPASTGTGAKVDPKLIDPTTGQIDETFLQQLLSNPQITNLLSQGVYDYATKGPYYDSDLGINTTAKAAEALGLNYLIDPQDTRDLFTGYAEEANKASDRTFTQAQRAYLAAIAAGDSKTIEALTSLAHTTGAGKQNIYKTSALTHSLNNQQRNANVGINAQTDYLNQLKNKQLNIESAKQQADNFRQNFMFGDSANPNAPSLTKLVQTSNATSAQGKAGYAGTYGEAMQGQSTFNDIVGANNNTTNNTLSNLANSLSDANSRGAAASSLNQTTINNTMNSLSKQEALFNALATGKTTIEEEQEKLGKNKK